MYSKGFVQTILASASGQPAWLASTIKWSAHLSQHNLTLFNTAFALTQVLIGIGLLYRPTVKPALAVSFAWALTVWCVGEGLGMLFTNTQRSADRRARRGPPVRDRRPGGVAGRAAR